MFAEECAPQEALVRQVQNSARAVPETLSAARQQMQQAREARAQAMRTAPLAQGAVLDGTNWIAEAERLVQHQTLPVLMREAQQAWRALDQLGRQGGAARSPFDPEEAEEEESATARADDDGRTVNVGAEALDRRRARLQSPDAPRAPDATSLFGQSDRGTTAKRAQAYGADAMMWLERWAVRWTWLYALAWCFLAARMLPPTRTWAERLRCVALLALAACYPRVCDPAARLAHRGAHQLWIWLFPSTLFVPV